MTYNLYIFNKIQIGCSTKNTEHKKSFSMAVVHTIVYGNKTCITCFILVEQVHTICAHYTYILRLSHNNINHPKYQTF